MHYKYIVIVGDRAKLFGMFYKRVSCLELVSDFLKACAFDRFFQKKSEEYSFLESKLHITNTV